MILKEKASAGFSLPRSISQEISLYLENKIIQNELKPGTRLIERNICASLGVSRISLREAFRILELSGLVKITPRKGAQVTAISRREIEEIYCLRTNLVGMAAKLAALHIKKDDLAKLIKICAQMNKKARKGDLRSYFQLNLKFHTLLSQAGGNRTLTQILENFGKKTQRFRFTSLSLPGRMKKSNSYHQLLIEAIKNGNGEEAEKIAATIIQEAEKALVEHPYSDSIDFAGFEDDPIQKAHAVK
jgi:DNA-binding GntR family transcriptional regulator